jgi:hypothetical protein
VLWSSAAWMPRHWHISLATVLLCFAAFSMSSLLTWIAVYLARWRRICSSGMPRQTACSR